MMQMTTSLTEILSLANAIANVTIILLPTSEDQACNRSVRAEEEAEGKYFLLFKNSVKILSDFRLSKCNTTRKTIATCREKAFLCLLH